MPSYQQLQDEALRMVHDQSTSRRDQVKEWINIVDKKIASKFPGQFMKDSVSLTTVASQSNYARPPRLRKLETIEVTVGGVKYILKEEPNLDNYQQFKQTTITSDIAQLYHIFATEIDVYPTPANAGNTLKFYGVFVPDDMTIDDATAGTVSVTNGSAAVTGSGTSWDDTMIGQGFKVENGDWYRITAVGSATALTLDRIYFDTTDASATYRIGALPRTPEDFHDLILFEVCKVVWASRENATMATMYGTLAEDRMEEFVAAYSEDSEDPNVPTEGRVPKDVNKFPESITGG